MIYSIGDLHFDHSKQKPMDIFGDNWVNHDQNIIDNWNQLVGDDDLVLVPGDISWALKLEEAKRDLETINNLPGKKVMIKGNHDYWWDSLSKLNKLNLDTIFFLQNNSYIYNNIGIVGTRGWYSKDSEGFTENDEKVFKRELNRLRSSLLTLKDKVDRIVAMVHYPPFNMDLSPNEFVDIMVEFKVEKCIYGHLHSDGHKYVVEGNIRDIEFQCVSSDFINFKPILIMGE